MAKKKRADLLLVEQKLAPDSELAKRLIMAGQVYRLVGEEEKNVEPVAKAGDLLSTESILVLKDKNPYVSRGAYKLLTALEHFKISVKNLVALDAGASTGGFTDCLLQHGAAKVYAIDVGYNQLHEKLKMDSRVVSMESTNLRDAKKDLIPEAIDLLVADVSFISVKAILEPCLQFLKAEAEVIILIKPQFEVAQHETVKGVVKDEALRAQAIDSVVTFATENLGLKLLGIVPAAIKGPKGNQEYLAYFDWGKTVTR